MSETTGSLDPTFRNYTSQQAISYSSHRSSYSAALYDKISAYHIQHGNGKFDQLVDVGCGTGGATRDFAIRFAHTTGLDPGTQMITRAVEIGGTTRLGERIRFEVVGAEDMTNMKTVRAGEVDVIISAMAAHWFGMEDFWSQAAKMLKPGGTVALWTNSSLYCHPSTPNAHTVQAALSHLEDDILGPYELPPNRLSREMYDHLVLPWRLVPPVTHFEQESFVRMTWNRNGQLESGEEDFFGGSENTTLAELASSLGTASMVTRWREANTDLADTDRDCVVMTMKNVAHAMNVGSEEMSKIRLRVGNGTVLLLFTKH